MDNAKINSELERIKKGFPWLDIAAPATPGRGIEVLTDEEADRAEAYFDSADIAGRCKFVPASGAASRMFKDIFAGAESENDAVRKLAAELENFAFYSPEVFGKAPYDPKDTARKLLFDEGLGYGKKPKGVLKFHRYPEEVRTAIAEHFVEGQAYMRNADGSVKLIVTISPEHRELFEAAVAEIKEKYEARYGVRYDVTFTYQDKATDTIAVDAADEPFRTADGSLLFRPAGHGALIHNLNQVEAELVSIKNIDNVAHEKLLTTTSLYKQVLMGEALKLRDRIFTYLRRLDANPDAALCDEIEGFLADTLCVQLPGETDLQRRIARLREKLDRPIRVCGMVRNEGEPGGGPYIIEGKDGSTSLQILESVQIDKNNPQAMAAMQGATHFNPVDLVCILRNYKGERFDLERYVDPEAGFISSKSYQGRELKALEAPGLWNGAMSDWNTIFVEVPLETFNPVKTVLDLLRPAHQG